MLAREWTRQPRQADDAAGTHIPFTSPLLSGVCVRANRNGLDFLLPNPSGGRGTYVVGWRSVAEYASPTLHDVILAGRLSELPSLDQATVRDAARAIAIEGYAGHQAADAARRGQGRMEAERLRLWSRLLMALIAASNLTAGEQTQALIGLGQAGPATMTDGLNTLAKQLGWAPGILFDALGRLSASHLPLCPGGRLPVLVSRFERLQADLSRELGRMQADPGQPLPASLRRLLPNLDHCMRQGCTAVEAAIRTLERPATLLECWRNDPAIAALALEAAERAVDGWDRIVLLWQDCASASARFSVLPEIALLVRLAAERTRIDAQASADVPAGRSGSPDQERTAEDAEDKGVASRVGASTPILVERNERIRALELELESGNA